MKLSSRWKGDLLKIALLCAGAICLNAVRPPSDCSAADDASAAKASGKLASLGEIKHQAVAKVPLPRDREQVGIGESVDFWLDELDDPTAIVSWQCFGGGTVYPVVGTSITVKVDAAEKDGEFGVEPTRRDSGPAKTSDNAADQRFTSKWFRKQLAALPKAYRKPVKVIPPPEPEFADELWKEIAKLDSFRDEPQPDLRRLDEVGNELLAKHADLRVQGWIYFQLAHVHAQCGLKEPRRVIELAAKALEYPLEPEQIPRLFVYWGDAVQLANLGEPLSVRRRAAAIPYLAGLQSVLRFNLPEKAPELPRVQLFDIIGDGAIEAERRQQQQFAAHRLAKFVGEMIEHREVLAGQLRALYRQEPRDDAELRFLAARFLKTPADVEWLISVVRTESQRKARHE